MIEDQSTSAGEVAELLNMMLSGTRPTAEAAAVAAAVQCAANEVVRLPLATLGDAIQQLREIADRESDPSLTSELRDAAREPYLILDGLTPATPHQRLECLIWRDGRRTSAVQ